MRTFEVQIVAGERELHFTGPGGAVHVDKTGTHIHGLQAGLIQDLMLELAKKEDELQELQYRMQGLEK